MLQGVQRKSPPAFRRVVAKQICRVSVGELMQSDADKRGNKALYDTKDIRKIKTLPN